VFFCCKNEEGVKNMPTNKKERLIFALITVIITVHAYVFYSLYVVNGTTLMNVSGASSVIGAINKMGGVYTLGHYLPIWAVVLIEFCFAYIFEVFVGSPFSFKMACKNFDIKKTNSVIFETAVICATVGIMVPIMSGVASLLYYPYYQGFNVFTWLANWLKLICFNFPFAYFTQLFFIQPLVRTIFKFLFKRQ
jgi:hypothetical protein